MSVCPKCSAPVSAADIDTREGVCVCTSCGEIVGLTELLGLPEPSVDLARPPKGAWFISLGPVTKFGARTRPFHTTVRAPGLAIWLGGVVITSIFAVVTAMRGVGAALFLIIVLTPFLIIGVFAAIHLLMVAFGKVEVTVRRPDVVVFTGVGVVGIRQRFKLSGASGVIESGVLTHPVLDLGRVDIVVQGDRRVQFGAMLSTECRRFVAGVLRTIVEGQGKS
jgi:hypothetical protein